MTAIGEAFPGEEGGRRAVGYEGAGSPAGFAYPGLFMDKVRPFKAWAGYRGTGRGRIRPGTGIWVSMRPHCGLGILGRGGRVCRVFQGRIGALAGLGRLWFWIRGLGGVETGRAPLRDFVIGRGKHIHDVYSGARTERANGADQGRGEVGLVAVVPEGAGAGDSRSFSG